MELAPDHHPTVGYVRDLRRKLGRDFPGITFYELPVDIVTQILNFGLPAPIDIKIVGRNLVANRYFAENLMNHLKFVPGMVDLRIQQPFNYPKLHIDVDRTKAERSRVHAARRSAESADFAQRQFPDRPGVLARSAHRRELHDHDADAAVSREFASGPRKHPGGQRERKQCPAADHGRSRFLHTRSGDGRGDVTTTFSPRSISTARWTGGILAEWRETSRRSSTRARRICLQDRRSWSAARSRR